jgi:hypothetical protein
MKQRFPSRDIWEDTPDSLQLSTTVRSPQIEEGTILSPQSATSGQQEKTATGPPIASDVGLAAAGLGITSKPSIPARPTRTKLSESPEKSHPAIPERPSKRSEATSPPVPVKSKPLVPARPSKPITRESSENVPLAKVTSNSSAKSTGSDQSGAVVAKQKPPVPSRPIGSKIAALQGGFMSDLNKRLQLGPQAPKKEEVVPEGLEVEKEKAPLVDARKGRARGPARRAPAKSPTPATQAPVEKSTVCGICTPSTLWQIDPEEDLLFVPSSKEKEVIPDTKATESETPTLATNTAGESLHPPLEIAEGAETSASPPSATEDSKAENIEGAHKESIAAVSEDTEIEPVKLSDEPSVKSHAPEPADEEELAGSTGTLKPEADEVVE